MEDNAKTSDDIETTKETVPNQPERKAYKVVSEAGLFKNGRHYKPGTEVELDEKTAANFLELGDIEDA